MNGADPYFIAALNSKISKRKLEIKKSALDFFFLKDLDNPEQSLRQFLVHKLLGSFNSNRVLVRTLGSSDRASLPFPGEWRRILRREGIDVNDLMCEILFRSFLLKNILKGFFEIFKGFSRVECKIITRPAVRVFGITQNCLPVGKIGDSYDFISWLDGERAGDNTYYHDLADYRGCDGRIKFDQVFYPCYRNFTARFRFLLWGIGSGVLALVLLTIGGWRTPALFNELIKKKRFEMGDVDAHYDEYIFTVSSPIYRPIWTEVVERKKKKLSLINYSTGYPHFKTTFGYTPEEIEYDLMSWPVFQNSPGLFNEYARTVCPSNVNITFTTPIWWVDCEYAIPDWGNKTIALYDVSAVSEDYLPDLIPYPFYRSYANGIQFLLDIYEVAEKCGYSIVYKRKRAFGNVHDGKFIEFVGEFTKKENVFEVPPEVSPFRLSQKTTVSISMPFTTTGHIAQCIGKPSIYYDPSGVIFSDDRAAESIALITSKVKLEEWLMSCPI